MEKLKRTTRRTKFVLLFFIALILNVASILFAQTRLPSLRLSLKEAVEMGVANYGTVKARQHYAEASKAGIVEAKREYLPNINFSAQIDQGTVNAQYGPLYGLGGLGAASVGPPLATQSWNAAFASLYLTNVNWDFFAFGRAREKIHTATALAERDTRDWQQEIFQQKVRVAGAYLNLLAAERLTASYRENLDRADTFRTIALARAINELIPGVDTSQANAEVANAKIALTNAIDLEQTQENTLIQLLGIAPQKLEIDTFFVTRLPEAADLTRPADSAVTGSLNSSVTGSPVSPTDVPGTHPSLAFYKSRVLLSDQQAIYQKTYLYPTFSLFGVFQERGSGFYNSYGSANPDAYTHNFYDGVKPGQANYLLGIGLTWNLTQLFRVSQQVKSQQLTSRGLQDEYDLAKQQLVAQLRLSETKMQNALDNYRQAPIEVGAASDAYTQKTVLYENGLTNLLDVTQAQYVLIRAETSRDIAYSNVWQALLLRAAAAGDMNIFLNNL